ncbi:unnamed protein product [Dovyalis caffra]|uniref:Uncharacterized protein n=1 Tax=Dovyalis caffra TaxID=77055 RepID=A0AAV1QXI0_9ROSI|nr:unnamed protein product [Dovyalis caffra]
MASPLTPLPHSPPPFQVCILEEMASEKANVGDLNASTSSKQGIPSEKMPSMKSTSNSNIEKALAQRALFGSRNHRTKGRKIKNSGAGLLPSRLSQVSLADDSSD